MNLLTLTFDLLTSVVCTLLSENNTLSMKRHRRGGACQLCICRVDMTVSDTVLVPLRLNCATSLYVVPILHDCDIATVFEDSMTINYGAFRVWVS